MTAANKIFKFSVVKNSCCDVIGKMKMFPFAKLFIEIIDYSRTKRVRALKFLPDIEHPPRIKISIFAKENIFKLFLSEIGRTNLIVHRDITFYNPTSFDNTLMLSPRRNG